MGKKNRNKKINRLTTPLRGSQTVTANGVVHLSKNPEAPVFWITLIIPIVCFVGAWTAPPVATPMELKSYASQIYLAGLLIIWLLLNLRFNKYEFKFCSARIAFLCLFLFGTASIFWAKNPDFWIYKWNKWYAGLAIFLMALHINLNEKNLRTIANLLTLAGLITAAVGISQYLFGFNQIPQSAFPSSTFGNANMAGQLIVLTGLFPLFLIFSEEKSKSSTWFYALSISLIFTYAFYTRTRAVWISCSLQIVLFVIFAALDKSNRPKWLNWSTNKSYSALLGTTLFIVMINFDQNGFSPVWEVAGPQIASITTSINSSAAEGEHRYIIWNSTLDMFKDSPMIGVGLGNWFEAYNNGGYADIRILGTQRAHNDIFELGAELGSIGLLILFTIILSMCSHIYRLVLESEGQKRIFLTIVTIALTGSMLNAQVSFPYQLPVPLIITPFLSGLLINGAECYGAKIHIKFNSLFFAKIGVFTSSTLFILILINDFLWFNDFKKLNKLVSEMDTETPWVPKNPFYNQAYITAGRSVVEALKYTDTQGLSNNVINVLQSYWPTNFANNFMMIESHLRSGDYTRAEELANLTRKLQPDNVLASEFYLMQIYMQTGQWQKLEVLYDHLKKEPENFLSKIESAYSMLHSASINLQDFEMTNIFFERFIKYWGENAEILANQGIYYINVGDISNAALSFEKALLINPDMERADEFRQFIKDYSDQ